METEKSQLDAALVAAVASAVVAQLKADRTPSARVSEGIDSPPTPTPGLEAVEAQREDGPGWKIARLARCAMIGHLEKSSTFQAAQALAKLDRRYGEVVKAIQDYEARRKAVSAGDLTAGGALIATPLYQDYIDLLRPQVIVRRMGATVIPVPSGSMDMGRMDAGATAQYVGENSGPNASEPQFGQLRFDSKKLSCIIPISNDFLRRSPAGAEAMIRKEMLARMGVREDLAFIRGDGAQNTPRGIKSFIAAGNTFTSAVTDATTNLTAANVGSDLGRARRLLKNANTPMLKVGWMISPRTEEAIRNIRDSVGGWLYKQEMDQKGTIDGIPYATSTQIPDNRGSGDESEIYLADFSEFLIGDTMAILMAVSDGAAYKNSSGVVTAAFTEDQTVIKVLSEHDTLLQHSTSAVLVEGCHYGAT